MLYLNPNCVLQTQVRYLQSAILRRALPRPGIPEPQLRQDMDLGVLRAAVMDGDEQQQVVNRRLGIFDEDIEVTVIVEEAGLEQFELGLLPGASLIFFHEPTIGEFSVRILVEHF